MSDLEVMSDINVKADYYFIGTAPYTCSACEKETEVCMIILPKGAEYFHEEEEDQEEHWERLDDFPGIASIGVYFPDEVRGNIESISKFYYPASKEIYSAQYWTNHCQHCQKHHNDSEVMFSFFPRTQQEADNINLTKINEPFGARAQGFAACAHKIQKLLEFKEI